MLFHITRLSGISDEIKFPNPNLTEEEELILNHEVPKTKKPPKRVTVSSSDSLRSCSDSQIPHQSNVDDQNLPRTMESLTNDMVSRIMGEVTRLSTEKILGSHSDSTLKELNETDSGPGSNSFQLKLLEKKVSEMEGVCLKLASLQFAAFKTLGVLLTSSTYSETFLINYDSQDKLNEVDDIKQIIQFLAEKSVERCKLKQILSLGEMERVESILHLSYIKSRSAINHDHSSVFENNESTESESTNFDSSLQADSGAGSSRNNCPHISNSLFSPYGLGMLQAGEI